MNTVLDSQIKRTARVLAGEADLEGMARLLDRAKMEQSVFERARAVVDGLSPEDRETILEALEAASDRGLTLDGQIELRRLVERVVRLAAAA